MSMAVPLAAGNYDLCSGTSFIGTVEVEGCGGPALAFHTEQCGSR